VRGTTALFGRDGRGRFISTLDVPDNAARADAGELFLAAAQMLKRTLRRGDMPTGDRGDQAWVVPSGWNLARGSWHGDQARFRVGLPISFIFFTFDSGGAVECRDVEFDARLVITLR
jgi:hypothetical protein